MCGNMPVTAFVMARVGCFATISAYVVDFVPKVKVEVVAAEGLLSEVVDAIERAGKTGRVGDGKIFVSEIEEAVRIRTGERGEDAL